jgi:CheY-like chemotaxis protein
MASASDTHQVVAVLNTSPDTVDLLKDVFERAGFLVASAYTHDIRSGVLDVEAFLRVHRPAVIVYDIAAPYERNWAYLQHLRSTALKDYRLVLTSPNAERVAQLVGRDAQVYEVVGKHEDLAEIVRATKEAARARSTV